MKTVIKTLRLFIEQMRFELHTTRVWLGVTMGLALFLVPLEKFLSFTKFRNEPVNILDGFLYVALNPQQSMLIILGFLFLLSDAPFIHERTSQITIRTSKRIWNSSCLLYIFSQAVLYYLFLLIFSMLLLCRYGYWGEIWSLPITQIAKQDTLMISQFNTSFPYWEFMKDHSVFQACLLTFTGNVLYACMLGEVLYVLNLNTRFSIGTWAAVFLHFSGYITRKEFNPRWSLQDYASPATNNTFVPLFLLILLFTLLSYWYIKRMDYCIIDKEF